MRGGAEQQEHRVCLRVDCQGDLSLSSSNGATRLIADALKNPHNREILRRLPQLGVPDVWLVAGCLFQTVWNLQVGWPPTAHIKDYDLFYFDDGDLSAAAENAIQHRAESLFADLSVTVEIKNQARVHLWYVDDFGFPYEALTSSRGGIDRFLVACTCIGLLPATGAHSPPTLYAPDGLDDLYAGLLRPNPLCDHVTLFEAKAESYRQRWPQLRVRAGC